MKKFISLVALLISALTSYAQMVFTANEVTVSPGEEAVVTVSIDNSAADIAGFSYDMTFPDWLELVADEDGLGDAELIEDRVNDAAPDFSVSIQDDIVRVVFATSNYKKTSIPKGSGALFTFKVKASSTVTEGTTGEITCEPDEFIIIVDGKMKVSEYSCNSIKVTVGAAAAETEKITLTKKYNTYVPAKALDFSGVDGITAYYVTAVVDGKAKLSKATTVAAGEGIILEGTADEEYEVPVATAEVAPSEDNLLLTSGIQEGDYILYDGEFVPCTAGTLAEGKAFLPKDKAAGAKVVTLVFGESTGINEVQKSEADGAIYNLSGMRVSKIQKGVYIMNGRKVIVK